MKKAFTTEYNYTKESIDLSMVVLCYHSGETILHFFRELEELLESMKLNYEIILVANDFADSIDKTKEIVLSLSKNNPKVIPLTKIKKGMMGWDMLQGFSISGGKYICVIDGDGQFPVESIREGVKLISNDQYDMVKTFRKVRKDGFYRALISRVYNVLFNVLFPGLNQRDVNSKPKFITKKAYNQMNLQSTDWFIDAEIMIQARKLKLSIKEYPIHFMANESRKSFVRFAAIIEFIVNLIRFKLKERSK